MLDPRSLRPRFALTAFAAVSLLAACVAAPGGGSGGSGPTAPGGSTSPTIPAVELPGDPNTLVIRVETSGGFVAPTFLLTNVPSISIYADGRMIQQGAIPAIYPSPFAPLLVSTFSAAQLQALLAAADTAALRSGKDVTYIAHGIADVPDTIVTVWGPTGVTKTTFGAFGMDQVGDIPADELAARKAAADFMTALQSPDFSTKVEPYRPAALRVYPADAIPDPNLPQQPVTWPLASRPAAPSADSGNLPGLIPYACMLVTGSDLDALWPLLLTSNSLTPWVMDGKQYTLAVRPILPDEAPACPTGN